MFDIVMEPANMPRLMFSVVKSYKSVCRSHMNQPWQPVAHGNVPMYTHGNLMQYLVMVWGFAELQICGCWILSSFALAWSDHYLVLP